MIRIKFEVEENEETPLPIESINVGFPEKNLVVVATKVPNKVVLKKKPKLDNSTTNSVAVGSKSIKTEPAESSLSLTTQLNNSLNIQSLLRQNRIQNGWTTNEQSIPIGTQQQQQQSLLLPKIESIVSEIQEVPLLDQSFSIPNLNSNSGVTTTTTNCDITTKMFPGSRAGLGCRAKLNKVCYSVPKKPEPSLPYPSSADNIVPADQHSGTIFGIDPSSTSTSYTTEVAAPSAEAAVPLLVGKKPLPRRVQPLTLEEKKERKSRENKLRYKQQLLANATPEQLERRRLKQMEANRQRMEKESEEQRQRRLERMRQYARTVGKQRRGQKRQTMTPEQREQKRLKDLERFRRHMEKESEEQRQQRLERMKKYNKTVRKQRWQTLTPEEREMKKASQREYYYRSKNKKLIMEKKKMDTMSQSNVKSKIYLKHSTDSDEDSD